MHVKANRFNSLSPSTQVDAFGTVAASGQGSKFAFFLYRIRTEKDPNIHAYVSEGYTDTQDVMPGALLQ